MTKVEELRDRVLHWDKYSDAAVARVPRLSASVVDSLISAAEFLGMKKQKELDAIWLRIDALVVAEARGFAKGHAEGVAEGAEQERERILSNAEFIPGHSASKSRWYDAYVFPASVLAPTKEKT